MIAERVKAFLEQNRVRYDTIYHTLTYTAQTTAEVTHIPGHELAKTVIVNVEGKPAMAVLPASRHVSLADLRRVVGCDDVCLAEEKELRELFPGCELGAMPPLGNLYGIDVYVDASLAEDDTIAFNAGSHTELVRIAFADFERLVEPRVCAMSTR